ncbi:MAG: hypothetical protein H6Q69_2177 [Firmicutes bacterium]|nr:hypothetical protein [Bacillota bacterium]
MKRSIIFILIVCMSITLAGCGNSGETSKLQNEIKQLKMENTDYKNRLTKYEALTKENNEQKEVASTEQPPVILKKIEFDKSGVTGVKVVFQNNTPKTIDAIEFVILQFDNFGRPAYRFNDKSNGNVSGKLLMQGNTQPQGTMQSGWTLYNTEKTVKGKTVVSQVHFTDGSVWSNLKFDEEVSKEKEEYK